MNKDFTFLKDSKSDKIINFLDQEIDNLNYLLSCKSTQKKDTNKIFKDYSRAIFVTNNDSNDIEDLILN